MNQPRFKERQLRTRKSKYSSVSRVEVILSIIVITLAAGALVVAAYFLFQFAIMFLLNVPPCFMCAPFQVIPTP